MVCTVIMDMHLYVHVLLYTVRSVDDVASRQASVGGIPLMYSIDHRGDTPLPCPPPHPPNHTDHTPDLPHSILA